MVAKKDIIDGVIDYAEEEMLPKITDKSLAMVIYFMVTQLKIKRNIADAFFENKYVKILLPEENGTYDIEALAKAIKASIKKFGGTFVVTIPAIPLISPSEKELKFSEGDMDDILSYILGDEENEPPAPSKGGVA